MTSEDLFTAIGEVDCERLDRSEWSNKMSSAENGLEDKIMKKKTGMRLILVAAVISLLAVSVFAAVNAKLDLQISKILNYRELTSDPDFFEGTKVPSETREKVDGNAEPYYVEIRFLPVDDLYHELPAMYPQEIPEGYTLSFVSDANMGSQRLVYDKADGTFGFDFAMQVGDDANSMTLLDVVREDIVTVCGREGTLYTTQYGGQVLVWQDEMMGVGFILSTEERNLDLVSIANTVAAGEKLTPILSDKYETALEELGDYRITKLPEGYREIEFMAYPGNHGYVRRDYGDGYTTKNTVLLFYEPVYGEQDVETVLDYRGNGEAVAVNGLPGVRQDRAVVWVDWENQIIFHISTREATNLDLLAIAESVEMTK